MRFLRVCGAVLLVAACAPNPAAPVKVMAIVPSLTGAYETRQIELTTITSITRLQGSVVKLVGGVVVEINSADPQQMAARTEEEYAKVLEKNGGADVRANFIDKSGVLWPADFHSWNMVTTYFNYEQSFNYFQKIYDGKPTDELLGARVFYWADFTNLDSGSDAKIKDNALWFPPVHAFLLVPFDKLQKVPFALNIGVIGHEYAHLVFNLKTFGGAGNPAPLQSWTLRPFNLL